MPLVISPASMWVIGYGVNARIFPTIRVTTGVADVLVEAGRLGQKSGLGAFRYSEGSRPSGSRSGCGGDDRRGVRTVCGLRDEP